MHLYTLARKSILPLGTLAILALSSLAQAQVSHDYAVDSQAMPWLNTANPSAMYGTGDGVAPLIITSADGYDFSAGGTFTFTYLSGLTSPYIGVPYADAAGDTTYDASNNGGSSGTFFPSLYVDSAQYPVYLNALIGTFTDSAGAIVGTPFAPGNGPFSVIAPSGATQLQFGVNDDIFRDNSGSLNIRVAGPTTSAVPEPGSIALFAGMGLSGAGFLARRKKARQAS